MHSKNAFVIYASSILLMVSCGKKDIDVVAEGQSCLDSATATTALACIDKVTGLDSAAANLVRCAAYFVDQGFSDPARISQVASQITNTGNQQAGTLSALTIVGFTATKYNMTKNDELSAASMTACQASKSGGLIYLSSMSRIATATLKDMGYDSTTGIAPTSGQMQTQLCTVGPSNTTKAAMGNAALAAYQQNCIGKDISKDIMCQQYAEAIGTNTDPTTIGASLTTAICTP